jgi:predicted ArsR family transcriptional regulator
MTKNSSFDPLAAVALLDEPTRLRLYEFVGKREAVGRDAAAKGLGISRELAAFHLDKLVEAGLLDTTFRRLSGRSGPGAGRPAKLYSLAARDISVSLPERHYEVPAEVFAEGLERLATDFGSEKVAAAVNEPARRRGLEDGAVVRKAAGPQAPRSRKRSELVKKLADDGFEPTIDASSQRLTLGNCPYRQMSDAHRDLTCSMNLAWAEGVVQGAGGTGYAPRLDFEPGRCCVVFQPTR